MKELQARRDRFLGFLGSTGFRVLFWASKLLRFRAFGIGKDRRFRPTAQVHRGPTEDKQLSGSRTLSALLIL